MNSTTLKAALIAVFAGFFMMGCEDNHAEEAGERVDCGAGFVEGEGRVRRGRHRADW